MNLSTFSSGATGLPIQAVSQTVKETEEWQRSNMEFFNYVSMIQLNDKIDDLHKYKALGPDFFGTPYQQSPYNTTINSTDTFGTVHEDEEGNEDEIKHYPIMAQPVNTIIGEYLKQPLNFYCVSNSHRSRNDYYASKTKQLMHFVQTNMMNTVIKELVNEGYKPDTDDFKQQVQARTPVQIQDYMNKDYRDIVEQINQKILTNLNQTEQLDVEFLDGFRHAITTAKEFYHIYTVGKKVKVKCVSPLNVFYQKSVNQRWVSESQYAGFRLYITPSEIIDTYGSSLKYKQIEKIEQLVNSTSNNKSAGGSYNTNTFADNQGSTFMTLNMPLIEQYMSLYEQTGSQGYYMQNLGLIKVVQSYWKSIKLIKVLTFYDAVDGPQEMLVDENYKADKTLGQYTVDGAINEVYQGTIINDDILVDVQPYEHQFFDPEDLAYNPLPIEGCLYNNLHIKPTSIVDLMMQWNELYDIIAHELEKDMKKAIGKVMFMSYDNLPKDLPKETWHYWLKEFGIAWVANTKAQQGNFSHYSSQDMSFAEQMLARMNILDRVKVNCDSFAGFSQPRLGDATQTNTLGQSNQAVVASTNQTYYWFHMHSRLIQRVLTYAVNIGKRMMKDESYLRNMLDDLEIAYVEFENLDIPNEKCNVFITNTAEAMADKEQLRSLLQPAMQNGADLVDLADIIMAKSQSEIRNLLQNVRDAKLKSQQQQQQAEQQQLQSEEQQHEKELSVQRELDYAKLDSQERIAYMKTFALQKDNLKDENSNSVPDILDYNEMLNNNQERANKAFTDRMKTVNDHKSTVSNERIKNRELTIREKELKVDEKNQVNDLKIARVNSKNRKK